MVRKAVVVLAAAGVGGMAGCSGLTTADREVPAAPLAAYETSLASVAPGEGVKLEGYDESFYDAGRLVLGAQPSEDDLVRARAAGVGTVINLRSNREMDDPERVPYDERAMAERLGMTYVHIPLGGDDGYEPADVDAFDAALAACDGEAMVHCASGGRVRSMMVAWVRTRRGWSPERAEEWRLTVGGQKTALEQLLGEPIADPAGR